MLERTPHPDILDAVRWRDSRPHALHRDYETRSPVELKVVGAHRYAADPCTEIVCAAYAVDDGPVRLWLREIRYLRNLLKLHAIQIG